MRQARALAQQQATQVSTQQAEIQKRIEAEATKRAGELVNIEREKQKHKSDQEQNATKQVEGDTTSNSRGSAFGRSQGARKRKAIADANAEKANAEKERDELREALNILEGQLGTGMRQYDAEDGTRQTARVKKSAVARVLGAVSTKTTTRPQEQEIVDLDAEETAGEFERVAKLLAHQAGARASASPDNRKTIRQSPQARLSAIEVQ